MSIGQRAVGVAALVIVASVTACGGSTPPLQTAEPGVVFTFPINEQLDVPLGSRIVVTFSDPVEPGALGPCSGQGTAVTGAFCLVGPDGPLDTAAEITGDGKTVQFAAATFAPGTTYGVYVRAPLAPTANNLPASGPLFSFTTRSTRPRAAPPTLVAVNGSAPDRLGATAHQPMFETTTIRLVFSEPLDPRSVTGTSAIDLADTVTGSSVPVTVYAQGIHVAIDPREDLVAGRTYVLALGDQIVDLGGSALAGIRIPLVPLDSRGGKPPIPEVLRTRQPGDPGPTTSRSGGERNVISIDNPLIGHETSTMLPVTVAAELGDPKALGGPIAFTIRHGQRLAATGLDVKLGGAIPVGLSTGNIQIELLTDGGGQLYRNPYQPADQRPENDRAPLFVDLSLDLAIYAVDPTGNAVLAQTVLGVQTTGTVVATDGVLAIETVGSLELGLLGITVAPMNLVLELITDPGATVPTDTTPPTLIATSPTEGSSDHPVGAGIELVFDEPVDVDRLRAGGLALETTGGQQIPSVIESHGSSIVVRPLANLSYSTSYRIRLTDIADVAGNALAATAPIGFATPRLVATSVPLTVLSIHPGVPCVLTGATATSPGHCDGGLDSDAPYQPFTMPADEVVEAVFSQPVNPTSLTLGSCGGGGSVRVDDLDGAGGCVAVAGTLLRRDRGIAFIPDQPWVPGRRYRLTLVSGSNATCATGEVCGANADAASFDPLLGTQSGDAGGSNLVINFVGAPATTATFMVADVSPFSDINGSGFLDANERANDDNRAALRIVGTTGVIGDASFAMDDCLPATPEVEGCLYLQGSMPVELGEATTNCMLPDGTVAPTCIPATLSPQAMYATSVAMTAKVGISITTNTGTSVLRIREPATGPIQGYVIDDGGTPTMVAALDLYMDAPDMTIPIPLANHDLISKPLSVVMRGAMTFRPDGRIAISLHNTGEVPVSVAIDAPLGIGGTVEIVIPSGEMKLQLVSRPVRGVEL